LISSITCCDDWKSASASEDGGREEQKNRSRGLAFHILKHSLLAPRLRHCAQQNNELAFKGVGYSAAAWPLDDPNLRSM